MSEHFDLLGTKMELLDQVIWTDTTYTGKVQVSLGVVVGFTPKMVKVRFKNKTYQSDYTIKTDRLICYKKITSAIEQYHGLFDTLDEFK